MSERKNRSERERLSERKRGSERERLSEKKRGSERERLIERKRGSYQCFRKFSCEFYQVRLFYTYIL